MSPINKQIIVDACVSPASLLPAVGGSTLLVGAWALGLGPLIAFIGLISIVAGVGIGITNMLTNYPEYAKRHYQKMKVEARQKRDDELDFLDERLLKDRDPKDQQALRALRAFYDEFLDELDAEKLSKNVSERTIERLHEMFDACVSSLKYAADLWDVLSTTRGKEREALIVDREQVINDVVSRVDVFGAKIAEIRTLGLKANKGDLDAIQEDLTRNLRVAKKVEERMSELRQDVRPSNERYRH